MIRFFFVIDVLLTMFPNYYIPTIQYADIIPYVDLLNLQLYCTGQAITHELKFWSAPPLFLEYEDIFQKSATLVVILLQLPMEPTWPIFELHL
jgi:hypothetical protein